MTRIAYTLAQIAMALLLLRLFIPIPGLTYVALALCAVGLAISIGVHVNAFRRTRRVTVDLPLSPQQVMRNTRAQLPTEYREWFDWTADIAGFDLSRPWIVGDSPAADEAYREWIKKQANRGIAIGRECVPKGAHKPARLASPVLIEIQDGQVVDNPDGGIRPHGICSYGPGVGWEEDWIEGHHVWIRRQS